MSKESTNNKSGRPKAEIDSEAVYKLAKLGANITEIADFHNVSTKTISRRFKAEVVKGKADMRLRLRQAQFDTAMKGNPALLIWLGKQMLNQTENGTFEEDDLLDDVDFGLDANE